MTYVQALKLETFLLFLHKPGAILVKDYLLKEAPYSVMVLLPVDTSSGNTLIMQEMPGPGWMPHCM